MSSKFSPRQQQIIEKSINLIADQGIQSLTTKRLAAEMGFTEPALYRHFKNKTAILEGILDTFAESVSPDAFQGDNPVDCIGSFILDRYNFFAAKPRFAKVMFSEEIFQNEEVLAKKVIMVMHRHKDEMAKYIMLAQKEGLIRKDLPMKALFRLIIGPFRLTVNQWCLSGYRFNLVEEGTQLWDATKLLLCKPCSVTDEPCTWDGKKSDED